jgi:hypothetical protein
MVDLVRNDMRHDHYFLFKKCKSNFILYYIMVAPQVMRYDKKKYITVVISMIDLVTSDILNEHK